MNFNQDERHFEFQFYTARHFVCVSASENVSVINFCKDAEAELTFESEKSLILINLDELEPIQWSHSQILIDKIRSYFVWESFEGAREVDGGKNIKW